MLDRKHRLGYAMVLMARARCVASRILVATANGIGKRHCPELLLGCTQPRLERPHGKRHLHKRRPRRQRQQDNYSEGNWSFTGFQAAKRPAQLLYASHGCLPKSKLRRSISQLRAGTIPALWRSACDPTIGTTVKHFTEVYRNECQFIGWNPNLTRGLRWRTVIYGEQQYAYKSLECRGSRRGKNDQEFRHRSIVT